MVCRKLLLQTSSVDGIARLKASILGNQQPETSKRAFDVYFEEQYHFSLAKFLQHHLSKDERHLPKGGALLQVIL